MKYRFETGGIEYVINLERRGDQYRVTVNGQDYDLEVLDAQPGQLSLRFENRPVTLYWAAEGDQKWISMQGCTYQLGKPAPRRAPVSRLAGEADRLRAPMPAQVRAVQGSAGDRVEPGQTLMLLEAMKMEIRLQAPRRGRIARILAKTGDTVERDQVLIEFVDELRESQ